MSLRDGVTRAYYLLPNNVAVFCVFHNVKTLYDLYGCYIICITVKRCVEEISDVF